MFDLGTQELIVIFIVALLVFGPKRLPELGRTLGRGITELKAALYGVKEKIEEAETTISEEVEEIKGDIEEKISQGLQVDDTSKRGVEDKKTETQEGEDTSEPAKEKDQKGVETDKDG